MSAARNDEIPAIADVYRFFAGAIRNLSGSLSDYESALKISR
ncbi:MAG: hypothetical protein WAW68_03045 [Rhodoferax sp.]